jgi:hypothetical protein
MTVFWDVVLCSLVVVYGHFTGAYCFHHQGDKLCVKNWVETRDQIREVKHVLRTSTKILDGMDELN